MSFFKNFLGIFPGTPPFTSNIPVLRSATQLADASRALDKRLAAIKVKDTKVCGFLGFHNLRLVFCGAPFWVGLNSLTLCFGKVEDKAASKAAKNHDFSRLGIFYVFSFASGVS